jgi:hypothetical protein
VVPSWAAPALREPVHDLQPAAPAVAPRLADLERRALPLVDDLEHQPLIPEGGAQLDRALAVIERLDRRRVGVP